VVDADERLPGAIARLRRRRARKRETLAQKENEETRRGCTFCVVILPGDRRLAARTVDSLTAQWWKQWHAVMIAPLGETRRAIADDPRARVVETADTVLAINRAIAESDADFVLFLEPGDQLTPTCLFRVMQEAHREPLLDLVYWDDALLSAKRNRRYRPSWSPETLLSANYIGNAFAIRRRALLGSGGLRDDAGDAVLWDALLRLPLDEANVMRIPRLLEYRVTRAERASDAGRRVVQAACDRRGLQATATLVDGSVLLRWRLDTPPHISIIIPTRHNRALLEKLFAGLRTTDYPSFDIVIVDNGDRAAANERWYEQQALPLTVLWWDQPFNYSAVNNRGAQAARGDALVFLNDDIEVLDPGWLRELAGWTSVDGVGAVGMQLLGPDGRIQHGGVILGVTGFAGHLFQGLPPNSDTLMGSTNWYRDVMAVTGACLAVRRDVYEQAAGFDERFILCGSDVAFGLTLSIQGKRCVCTPFHGLRHVESATRGTEIPSDDFQTSFWAYQPWLRRGDPYFSPALSLQSGIPAPQKKDEPDAMAMVGPIIGREFEVFRSGKDLEGAGGYALRYRASASDERAVRELHARNRDRFDVASVNWFIPGLDSPFYGGINTAFRIADHLQRNHGVLNRFVVMSRTPEGFIRAGIAAAFPDLRDSPIEIVDIPYLVDLVPPADVAIATLWTTAYDVAHYGGARRKFYLMQDFEPVFYPAGTIYALAEESYRLGLYGLCNTENLATIYSQRYAGRAHAFTPAVDGTVFHARGRGETPADEPVTVFVYARPGHWRNCWELAYPALVELKRRAGDRVRVVAAGSWAIPQDKVEYPSIHQLGLLDYRATGALYRHTDIGLALTVSAHPSYLPLELMACGAAVVAFDNPSGHWLLKNEENCLLTPQTVDGVADALERLVVNPPLRRRLAAAGLARIQEQHSSWPQALSAIYDYLCDPEEAGDSASAKPVRRATGVRTRVSRGR